MVSLRISLPALRYSAALAGHVFVAIGASLIALYAMGLFLPGSSGDLPSSESFDLVQANRCIYLSTTHSDDRRIAVTENWLQWSLGHLYAPLARTQNPERLWDGRLANCSERSQILKTLAEQAGNECRFIGLSGHVVLEVQTALGWQVADPDYGVVYPAAIADLQQADGRPLIRHTLSAAGYPAPNIERYLAIVQSTDDNVVLPVGSPLSPRLFVVERACDWLAPLLPLGLLAMGAVLLQATRALSVRRRFSPVAYETGQLPRPA
jgi:hypothetical protein